MDKIVEEIFKLYSPNFDKLTKFGFKKQNNKYLYEKTILDRQFNFMFKIELSGNMEAKVFDAQFGDEYILHLMEDIGEFAIRVKNEYEKILTEIRDACFEKVVFKSKNARMLINYVREKYGDELEFLWESSPDVAILRRKDNRKWYAVLFVLNLKKLGVDRDEFCDVIDLRINTDKLERLVDGKTFFRGFHMNKNHWLTICLDGSVSDEKLLSFLEDSYLLAIK